MVHIESPTLKNLIGSKKLEIFTIIELGVIFRVFLFNNLIQNHTIIVAHNQIPRTVEWPERFL